MLGSLPNRHSVNSASAKPAIPQTIAKGVDRPRTPYPATSPMSAEGIIRA